MSSKDALDLQRPECSAPSEDRVLKHFGFPLVHLSFFRKIKAWDFYGCGFRSHSEGTPPLLSLS